MRNVILALALGVSSGSAAAEATVSASNEPAVTLNGQLRAMLGQERSAMQALDGATVRRLVRPAPAQGAVELSRAGIAALPAPEATPELECLAEALYFEARGESIEGQLAVAEVIINRAESSLYPDTVCDVINQGTGELYGCQFTYNCDGHPEEIHEKRAWRQVRKVADLALDGAVEPLTEGATHYHTRHVSPAWARKFPRTTTIGVHYFYRHPTQVVNR